MITIQEKFCTGLERGWGWGGRVKAIIRTASAVKNTTDTADTETARTGYRCHQKQEYP